jgi:hypothetical protein
MCHACRRASLAFLKLFAFECAASSPIESIFQFRSGKHMQEPRRPQRSKSNRRKTRVPRTPAQTALRKSTHIFTHIRTYVHTYIHTYRPPTWRGVGHLGRLRHGCRQAVLRTRASIPQRGPSSPQNDGPRAAVSASLCFTCVWGQMCVYMCEKSQARSCTHTRTRRHALPR